MDLLKDSIPLELLCFDGQQAVELLFQGLPIMRSDGKHAFCRQQNRWWVLTRPSRGVWMTLASKLNTKQVLAWWETNHAKDQWMLAESPVADQPARAATVSAGVPEALELRINAALSASQTDRGG
jgi:hypothetical protein